LTFYEQP